MSTCQTKQRTSLCRTPALLISLSSTLILVAACGSGGSGGGTNPAPPGTIGQTDGLTCSTIDLNTWVDRGMRDFYLFYKQVPTLDLASFDSPEDTIRELRVNPPDKFSNVQDANQQSAFFGAGITFGFGFSYSEADDGTTHFNTIVYGSPMQDAGFKRGDVLVALNDIPIDNVDSDTRRQIFGVAPEPKTVVFTILDDAGAQEQITVSNAEYRIQTVPFSQTYNFDGVLYGYLPMSSFTETSRAELDFQIATLRDMQISELVLDLRYNGGGRTSIAAKLASQIGGDAVQGDVFEFRRLNDRYSQFDSQVDFSREDAELGLPRIVVLVSPRTASSSELVINGLKPHINVTVIGNGTTAAKPFQTRGRDFCGKTMNALEFVSTNSASQDVIDGIPVDCFVEDDITREFGDPEEGMLAAGLAFLRNGTCNTAPAAAALATSTRGRVDESTWGDVNMEPMGLVDR